MNNIEKAIEIRNARIRFVSLVDKRQIFRASSSPKIRTAKQVLNNPLTKR